MAIQKEKLYLYEHIDYRAPHRYVSAYVEHEMPHMDGAIILLGEIEIDVDYPEVDTRQSQIDGLERAIKKDRAESQSRVNILLDRISKLKAIRHDAPVSAEFVYAGSDVIDGVQF